MVIFLAFTYLYQKNIKIASEMIQEQQRKD